MQLRDAEVTGRRTPVGIVPTREELDLTGSEVRPEDLDRLLTIDTARWRQEMANREQHLAQFDGLPAAIWEAHHRVAAALAAEES
jgi:phosphoenolpyruvate carboxykinase (GTP)